MIRELQEKYRQAKVFYRTGRLAFEAQRVWDSYDKVNQSIDDGFYPFLILSTKIGISY